MIGALRIVQRNALVYRRAWRGTLLFSFLQPTLFLLAMGMGLGARIDQPLAVAGLAGGLAYLEFLAPGLLAAACMQTAAFESSYPIAGKMNFHRTYEAIAATPIGIASLVAGELAWITLRAGAVAIAFTAIISLFGIPRSSQVLLAVPAGMLIGLAFSAVVVAYSGSLRNPNRLNFVFRFGITPLFLFSGVFFPVDRLPGALGTLARLTPLYHGVELVRGSSTGTLAWPGTAIHAGYLLAMASIGIFLAVRTFRRRLEE
jgi:lipooligosaccharide transport system permease protein